MAFNDADIRTLSYISYLRAYYDNRRTAREVGRTLLLGELFTTEALTPRLDVPTTTAWLNRLVDAIVVEGAYVGSDALYVAPPELEEDVEAWTMAQCMTYLRNIGLASTIQSPGNVSMAVKALVAYAKKGTASEALLEKLSESLNTTISKTCVLVGNDISNFYQQYGRGITEVNAVQFFTRVQAMIPGECLPIVTLLNQVANTGLTAAMVVKDAVRKYPGFPWGLTALFPDEIDSCAAVITQARANPYIGFKTNLGDIALPNIRISLG